LADWGIVGPGLEKSKPCLPAGGFSIAP
jgi:hypothetical protein